MLTVPRSCLVALGLMAVVVPLKPALPPTTPPPAAAYAFRADFDTTHALEARTYRCGSEGDHVVLDADMWCEAQLDVVNEGGARGKVVKNYVLAGQRFHQGLVVNRVPQQLDGWFHMLAKFPVAPPRDGSRVSLWGMRWANATFRGAQTEDVATLDADMRLRVIGDTTGASLQVPLGKWVSIRVHVARGAPANVTLIATDVIGVPLVGGNGGQLRGRAVTIGQLPGPGRIKYGQGGEIFSTHRYVGWNYSYDNLYVSNGPIDPGPWVSGP